MVFTRTSHNLKMPRPADGTGEKHQPDKGSAMRGSAQGLIPRKQSQTR